MRKAQSEAAPAFWASCLNGCLVLLLLCPCAFAAAGDTAAILPFANASAEIAPAGTAGGSEAEDNPPAPAPAPSVGNIDWIGESIAETVRDVLESRGVVTLDRGEIQDAYHRLHLRERALLTEASAMKAGEAVDAEQVVYGKFAFEPAPSGAPADTRGSLKISARIVDRKRLRRSSAFEEIGALEDLATLESHLAWRVLKVLAPSLAPPESAFRDLRPPVRLDAEENYIRGLMDPSPEQREKFFTQAARLDLRFGHPRYQLGQMHFQKKEYRQAAEWLEQIDPSEVHYRQATFLLGLALFHSGDYAGARKAFQTIAAAVPLSAVWNDLAAAESRLNLPQAVDDFRKALAGDPNDPDYHFNVGYALWKKGDFAEAADLFRADLDRNSGDQMATLLLGRCLQKRGLRPSDSGDARLMNLERLKTDYEERAYRQLKSVLDSKKP